MSDIFPKVNISNFDERKEEVSAELAKAAKSIGFFYITGHGISDERIARAFDIGNRWFTLNEEQKDQYKLDLIEYVGWKGEATKRKHDRGIIEQQIFGHVAENNPYARQLEQQAKEFIPNIEEFTHDFLDDLLRISTVVLRGLALALGQPEDFFVKGLDRNLPDIGGGGGWNNYWPYESTKEETKWRIPAHADAELFTLLFQQEGQPGLEVTPGKDFFDVANKGQPFLKNWDAFTYPPDDALTFHPMPPVKGAITVNIGDLLMRWSDGEYLSTYHRVRAPTKDNGIPTGGRQTLVYFANPARSTVIQGPKKRWPAILSGEETANMAAKHYSKVAQRYYETGRLDSPAEATIPKNIIEPAQPQPQAVAVN
ncbi:hypothetical protein WJX73_010800 [Symbiochloris irregularis]|uniref:Fe2OG dioxygenase domain-containing protein n=1 Tax=Symbiochloris irregularis TaxID=706552 RepID=A0AAW1PGA4_9CHLO